MRLSFVIPTRAVRPVVALPFKAEPTLGQSRDIALSRFRKLEYRLEKNPTLKRDYHLCLLEYIDLDHMEPCIPPMANNVKHYYIPHHAVIKESSQTTRTRVVFDSGCKSTNNKYLNDLLLTGPKLHADIIDILLNFRIHAIAFIADIKQMYRNVLVRETDRDFQRIVWRSSPDQPIRDYRLRTVTFGVSSSPYLALRVIRQLADDEAQRFPLASQVLMRHVFVDDVASGSNTVLNALSLQRELVGICKSAGFELRKWFSNSPAILNSVVLQEAHGERESTYGERDPNANQNVLFSNMEDDKQTKILGLQWDPKLEIFNFNVQPSNHACNKRIILSEIAKIYDP